MRVPVAFPSSRANSLYLAEKNRVENPPPSIVGRFRNERLDEIHSRDPVKSPAIDPAIHLVVKFLHVRKLTRDTPLSRGFALHADLYYNTLSHCCLVHSVT